MFTLGYTGVFGLYCGIASIVKVFRIVKSVFVCLIFICSIILVISLLLKTGVHFNKYGMFLLGVVGQTLASNLEEYRGKDEGRGRDLVAKLDLWDVSDRILGSKDPGCCVVFFLRQGDQNRSYDWQGYLIDGITDLVIVMITYYKRVDCSLMLVLIIYVTKHLGGLGGGVTRSVNYLSVIKSIYWGSFVCLACIGSIILVISLLLRTGVCFDKYGMFLLGVVGQTLANSLTGYGVRVRTEEGTWSPSWTFWLSLIGSWDPRIQDVVLFSCSARVTRIGTISSMASLTSLLS